MAEKDFRVRKGIIVDGTGASSIAGSLGIGVTNPYANLTVNNNLLVSSAGDTADPKVEGILHRITNTNNDNPDMEIFFVENHGLGYGFRMGYDGANNRMRFFTHENSTSGSEVMRFDRGAAGNIWLGPSANKVMIGTTDNPKFPLHLKYTDHDTTPQGASTSGSGTVGASAEGGGLYIENASTTDGSYAGITFRTDTADARIAWQSVGSSLSNEGQMSFFVDTNDNDSASPNSVFTLEEVLRLRGGSSDSDSNQAFNSAYINGRLGVGTATPTDSLAVRGGIKIGEFNDTDGTGYAGTSPPSAHNNGTGAADPQIRVSGRSTGNPGIIQLAQFDANNFLGGTTQFELGRIQFAMNENTNAVTNVAEIRGVSSDPHVPGHFDGALQFWTSQGDSSGANLTQKMILDADGNVGIGTTSPVEKLHVEGDIRSDGTFLVEDLDANYHMIQLTHTNASADYDVGIHWQGSPNTLGLHNAYGDVNIRGGASGTLSTPHLTVKGDGDTAISGNLLLDGSNKELRFYEGANYVGFEAPALSANQIWVLPATDGSSNQALTTDGSGNFQWTSAGSIAGVGSNLSLANGSNNRILTAVDGSNINGEATFTYDGTNLKLASATPRIYLSDTDNSSGSNDGNSLLLTKSGSISYLYDRQANSKLYLGAADDSDIMIIDGANARVGIGTTAPDTKLHVEGSVLIDAYEVGAGAGLYFREGFLNTNQPSITVQDHNGSNPDGLAISAYDGISFRLNAVEKARFDSSGNLGIGTDNPSSKLDVAGTIECTGLKLQNGTLDYGTGNQQSENLAVGWYTVAYVSGRDAAGAFQRAFGEFLINCNRSSRHGTARFNATHFFGAGESIQAFAYNFFSTPSFTKLRIKSGGTYSGAALQVYVSNASNDLESYMTMTEHTNSWLLLNTWLLDTESGGAHDALVGYGSDAWANFGVAEELDLSVFTASSQGGIYTTGGLKAEEIRNGKAGTSSYIYLSPDTDNSYILASSNGSDVTIAADDDMVLHADDAIIFQTEAATKFGMHNGKFGIGASVATTTAYPLGIESAAGLAINQGTNDARHKRIFATTSNDGSPWDEMVYYSRGAVGGWSGQHTFMVDKNGESAETGYEALRIRDSGDGSNSIVAVTHKLGVGTTSPDATLHIDAPTTTAPSLTFGAAAGQILQNENSELAIGLDNASPYSLWIQGRTSGNAARNIGLQGLGGKVGIGTDAPDTLFEIKEGGSGAAVMRLRNSNTSFPEDTAFGRIEFYNADASGAGVTAQIEAVSDASGRGGQLAFKTDQTGTNPTTKMMIQGDGNVGIGTDAPFFATGIGLEIEHASQANLRVTDSSASASSDFAQSENDLYIVNRKSGGNIRMRVGGSTETILMDSDGDIKFANGATSSWATWNSVVFSRKNYNELAGSGAGLNVEYDGTGTHGGHLIPFTAKIRAIAFHINGTAGGTVDDDSTTNQVWNFFKGGNTSTSFTSVTFTNDANLTRQGTTNHWYYVVTGLNISVAAGETLHARRESGNVTVGNVRIEVFYSHV